MMNIGQSPMGAFALYVLRPTWIGSQPQSINELDSIVWSGVGPSEVPINARRDGFIILDFERSSFYKGGEVPSHIPKPGKKLPDNIRQAQKARETLAYKRFQYMNALLFGLYSGISTIQKTASQLQPPVDFMNYFAARQSGKKWEIYSSDRAPHYPTAPDSRGVFQTETVAHAIELMTRCERTFGDSAIELLTLTYIASHHYRLHQFPSAHLIAWSVIEKQLNVMWSALLKEVDVSHGGFTAMSKNRRKALENGRDYSASVISQILSIQGKMDDELLLRLDEARKKRNDFAHSLAPVDSEDASKAIRTATDLMTKIVGFEIRSQLSLSFWL